MMELLQMIGNLFKLACSLIAWFVASIISLFGFVGKMLDYIDFYDSLLIPAFALSGISLLIAVAVVRIVVSHDLS